MSSEIEERKCNSIPTLSKSFLKAVDVSSACSNTAQEAVIHQKLPNEVALEKQKQAENLFQKGDYDGALHLYNNAIFLMPEEQSFYERRAKIYWEMCDLKSAIASYRKLFSLNPSPSQAVKDDFASLLDVHGYSLLILGEDPSIPVAYISEAIRLNGLEETFWLHRALAYIKANAYGNALKDIDHVICLNASDVEYFILRAKLHWRLQMHEPGNADIAKASKMDPLHPEVIEYEQRMIKESQIIYEEACRQLMLRDFHKAIELLSSVTETNPEETKYYILRSSAYRDIGNFNAALEDIDRAFFCHQKRMKNQGIVLISGQKDKSKEYRTIANQKNLILNDLACHFIQEKSYQLGLNAMNQAICSEKELAEMIKEGHKFLNPLFYVNRGDCYCGLENYQAALADYKYALEILPERKDIKSRIARIHYIFGVVLFNKAQFDQAEIEFTKAIEKDSSIAIYYVRRADAARYLLKNQRAYEDYTKALELNPSDTQTRDKLSQYAASYASASASASASGKTNNKNLSSPTIRKLILDPMFNQVKSARKSYKQKNQMVQELFHERPSLTSPSKQIPYKIPNIPQKPKNSS